MYEQKITGRDEGQRFDKYLQKLLPNAGSSFLYKMMRKKNITLNDKKAAGPEKLKAGDTIKIFFSDETLQKFMGQSSTLSQSINKAYKNFDVSVVFENEHLLFVNKPVGMLSQKAEKDDYSINEWILDYLMDRGSLSDDDIRSFRPSVCNRLDRNTSGLILCAKSIKGAQFLSEQLKERSMEKQYLALVQGKVDKTCHLKGYLVKDEKNNKVTIYEQAVSNGDYIETSYEPLYIKDEVTLLKVHLITGKSHQIRAHLASVNHPIIGDKKYGNLNTNKMYFEKFKIKSQLLHAWYVVFDKVPEGLGLTAGEKYTANPPAVFSKLSDANILI